MTKKQLWDLRKQIVLNSLYYSDFQNNMGINRQDVSAFFDGYIEFLGELMTVDGVPDENFWDELKRYDNADNLENWYGCFEGDPLPVQSENKEEAA